MNFDPDNGRKQDPGKKKANVEALEDQVTDILNGTDTIDVDSLGLSEDIKRRLGDADLNELARIERELGISVDEEIIQTVSEQTIDDEYSFVDVEDETIEVEEVPAVEEKTDGKSDIVIAEDKMSASISLFPSRGAGKTLNIDKIRQAVNSLNIVYVVNYDLLKELIEKVEVSKTEKTGVIFAKGTPPKEGRAGGIEFNFSDNEDVLKKQEEYVASKPATGREKRK